MQKQSIQFVRGLALLPFFTMGSPFAMIYDIKAPLSTVDASSSEDAKVAALDQEHADKIDAYFSKRNMPLAGYGAKMVAEAEANDLDWRLIPAIAVKESTGGKFACGHNPFGWGSCKIKFKSWDESIETVARNLGGNNPATARYYDGTTTKEKLHHYNGSVVPTYTGEVMKFMELIEREGEEQVS